MRIITLVRSAVASLAIAGVMTSVASAGHISSLGVESLFQTDPTGWDVGDVDSTYQEWDAKAASTGNVPDVGNTAHASQSLTDPTQSVLSPGFRTGTSNFYSFSNSFGVESDIYNHGGVSGGGGYGPNSGTHVIVQIGTSVTPDPAAWALWDGGAHTTEIEAGHSIGVHWDTVELVTLGGAAIIGGTNADALVVAENSFREGIATSFGPTDYQELIFEFWLPNYTDDFRIQWGEVIHSTVDMLRVDTMIGEALVSGGSPFQAVPEPSSVFLLVVGLVSLGGVNFVRRRNKNRDFSQQTD